MFEKFLSYACEWHAVEVLLVTHLNASDVEAHYGGVVARCFLCVAASALPLPCQAVEGVVLMSYHVTAHL